MTGILLNLAIGLLSSAIAFACGIVFNRRYIFLSKLSQRSIATVLGSGSRLTVCFSARGVKESDQTTLREGDVLATLDIVRIADRYLGRGRVVIAAPAEIPVDHGDLILVGGPNANPRTKIALRPHQYGPAQLVTVSGYCFVLRDGTRWELEASPDGSIETDYGVIYSMPDPEEPRRRITLVFGLKGFGTRAAARFLGTRAFALETRDFSRSTTYCLLISVDIESGQVGPGRLVSKIIV